VGVSAIVPAVVADAIFVKPITSAPRAWIDVVSRPATCAVENPESCVEVKASNCAVVIARISVVGNELICVVCNAAIKSVGSALTPAVVRDPTLLRLEISTVPIATKTDDAKAGTCRLVRYGSWTDVKASTCVVANAPRKDVDSDPTCLDVRVSTRSVPKAATFRVASEVTLVRLAKSPVPIANTCALVNAATCRVGRVRNCAEVNASSCAVVRVDT
jgi:hypothetical protein